jgi:hypothetical protein
VEEWQEQCLGLGRDGHNNPMEVQHQYQLQSAGKVGTEEGEWVHHMVADLVARTMAQVRSSDHVQWEYDVVEREEAVEGKLVVPEEHWQLEHVNVKQA